MNRLLGKLRECDGYFCEQVAMLGFAIVTFSIIYLSISQITA